jgi:Fe-Mn family superoxide dismutase
MEATMAFQLPDLPYAGDALEPYISAETIDYHFGKHHRAYVDNLNRLTDGTDWQEASLTAIMATATGGIYNNAAQVWNHSFYWNSLSPEGGGEPPADVAEAIEAAFGSLEAFKESFSSAAVSHFGSGWAWLVRKADGSLSITSTSNADNPLREGATPVLTCDVWEHAYYIDYRNARPKYVEAFWDLVNWAFVRTNLAK